MPVRLATFNVENLFTRFLFARGVPPAAQEGGFTTEDLRFRLADPESKRLTADVIASLRADVLALQEVEDLDTLKVFRDRFLGGRAAWPHALVIDGNDDRRIDVGVLSRLPIVHARSWQHLPDPANPDALLFSRDCLEVDVDVPGLGPLTLYVNHLKSMRSDAPASSTPGRTLTQPLRSRQASMIREIVRSRFRDPADAAFVVLGDLNDYAATDAQGETALGALLTWDAVENVVERLPADERWTHHFAGRPEWGVPAGRHQLDYLLPSRRLADRNPQPPTVERRGLARRAGDDWPRLPGVGFRHPKASDHCPVVWEFDRW
jgi:endonuclease/exonuclease/phosphatase family metal-dependent hydrolase